jgi:hypothetical protein
MDSERYEVAAAVAEAAETLVRACEADLEAARNATAKDIAETRLREALATQDQALEMVGPALEERELEVRKAVRAAIDALLKRPGSDWMMARRRWHSIAVKSRLVGMMGHRRYLTWFPW